jgi:hypothetical protein
MACRLGEWKAHFMTQTGYGQPNEEIHDPPLLFHLEMDPSESRNVAETNAAVLAEIKSAVQAHRTNLIPAEPQLN